MIPIEFACSTFLIAYINQIFKALSYLQGHLYCFHISCTHILLYKVLAVIPGTICMWDSLLCYSSVSFLCQHMLYYFIPWFSGHLIVCTIASVGIGMPPPPPSKYSLIKKTCHTSKSPPQVLVLSALWFTLYFSLFDFPFDV